MKNKECKYSEQIRRDDELKKYKHIFDYYKMCYGK